MRNLMRAQTREFRSLKVLDNAEDAGVVICVFRNEIELLPYFLQHYRQIGVNRFAFVDNGSTDESISYLLSQNDCDIYQHTGSFRAAAAGVAWKNILLEIYAGVKWCLIADADEHVVYDGWPRTGIQYFAAEMSRRGRSVATGIMIDMYPETSLRETDLGAGRSPLDLCPFFDGDGYRIQTPADWRTQRFPRMDIRGGPMRRIVEGPDLLGWRAKTPLILEPRILLRDPHCVYPVGLNFSTPHLAILHFRFLGVAQKIDRVRMEQQHSKGSISAYLSLDERLRLEPNFSLMYPGSLKFTSARQLVDLGLIQPVG